MTSKIHSTAIIDKNAKIADDVEIGPYTIIGKNVIIGKKSKIFSHVIIDGNTKIGINNQIYPFTSIGLKPQHLKYSGEITELIIGDNNTFRENVTIHPGTNVGTKKTIIGNGNFFMVGSHIAHDCIVGNNNVMSNSTSLAGHVIMGNNIVLAGYVLVHQFCRIGDFAFAGMGAALNQDLPPYLLATGSFAKTHGLNREGLRRNNFDQKKINALHKAYKLIFRSSNNPTNTNELDILCQEYKEVLKLLNFIEKSDRGVIQSSKQE